MSSVSSIEQNPPTKILEYFTWNEPQPDVLLCIWRILEWLVANQHMIPPRQSQELDVLIRDAVQNWQDDPNSP